MSKNWFTRSGGMYIPNSAAGASITLFAIIFLIPVFTSTMRTSHSMTDALYTMFVYTTCVAFWWKWIAEKTSE